MTSFPVAPPLHNYAFTTVAAASASSRPIPSKRPFYPRSPDPAASLCRCSTGGNSPASSSGDGTSPFQQRWDSAIQNVLKNAIKRYDSVMNSYRTQGKEGGNNADSGESETGDIKKNKNKVEHEDDEWDWETWKKHFQQMEEKERLLLALKSQLKRAVEREDYQDAARVKVAIAAAATNDPVGIVMSSLRRAVVEERYKDAAYLRDKAGAGLVGWWSGISEDVKDPYGLIIQITAEYGRYVARSFNPRQLTASALGTPLFEIYITVNKKGNYKKQAVYLKWKEVLPNSSAIPSGVMSSARLLASSDKKEDRSEIFIESTEDEESDSTDDDSDLLEESSGFQSFLQDMIPGVKVKVVKVTVPEKGDKGFISKVIDQINDEEDEDEGEDEFMNGNEDEVKDTKDNLEAETETDTEIDEENDDIELESVMDGIVDDNEGTEIAIKVVIGDIVDTLSGSQHPKESLRLPANLDSMERSSFSLRLEKDVKLQDSRSVEHASVDGKAKLQSKRRIDNLMFDLAKSIEKEKKISLKMLKDVSELLSLTLSQAQKRKQLSGLTTFRRIDVTPSPDPLDGLYIGAHGLYASEVIHLKRKFGQWKDDEGSKKSTDIEFYEYVEAVKLTGDPYVPAGKVAFRARIGGRYELPLRGLIPEEFGVIARYKGQGRLADPGFRNPRWVDGELVILDGKYVKGGPVVGFVYWAPEHHFVVFFNRLRLQS